MSTSQGNEIDIVKLRNSVGFTQEQMAEHLGVSRSYYNQVEKGSRPLTGSLLERVLIMKMGDVIASKRLHALKSNFSQHSADNASVRSQKYNKERGTPVLALNEDQLSYPRDPKEEDCIRHLGEYLEYARNVPGGIGYCYTQLKLHLSIETIKKLKEEES